jgi:hypothetical protein
MREDRVRFADVTDALVWVLATATVIEGLGLVTLWVPLIHSRREFAGSRGKPTTHGAVSTGHNC